jgi:hypothetical protein
LYKEAKSRLIVLKNKSKNIIKNIKVFKDKGYNISNLLNKTNISKEKYFKGKIYLNIRNNRLRS